MANAAYSFDEQQADFLIAEAKYALKLKQKLDAGEITQDYYDQSILLASQSLDSPYAGFRDEFVSVVAGEPAAVVDWLAQATGKLPGEITAKLGNVIGSAAGGFLGGVTKGIATNLGVTGWIYVLLLILVAVWAFSRGPLSEVKVKAI